MPSPFSVFYRNFEDLFSYLIETQTDMRMATKIFFMEALVASSSVIALNRDNEDLLQLGHFA